MKGRGRGPRKVGDVVPAAEQDRRVLEYLRNPANRERLLPASWCALAIWPDNRMRAQGAALAVGPVLARLRSAGLIAWRSERRFGRESWGWYAVRGCAVAVCRVCRRVQHATAGQQRPVFCQGDHVRLSRLLYVEVK